MFECAYCSVGADLLARCEEDRGGVWIHVIRPSLTLLFLCAECVGLSLSGSPHCNTQLQNLQKCPAGSAEVGRGPSIQVGSSLKIYIY